MIHNFNADNVSLIYPLCIWIFVWFSNKVLFIERMPACYFPTTIISPNNKTGLLLTRSIIQGRIWGHIGVKFEITWGKICAKGWIWGESWVKLEANRGQNKVKISSFSRLGILNWKFMILPLVSFKNRGKPQKYR